MSPANTPPDSPSPRRKRAAPVAKVRRPAGERTDAAAGVAKAARRAPNPSAGRARRRPTSSEAANRTETKDQRSRGGRRLRARVGQPPDRVDRSVFGQPSGMRASAGRALAVGLVCFGLWTLFDAHQLYHNAMTSPFGTRRSVAMAILRPIAAVTDAVGLSGPVNTADSALGRNLSTTSPTLPPPPPPPAASGPRALADADSSGIAPKPHNNTGQVIGTLPPIVAPIWPPPLRQPSRAHPLVLLDIGDSIGEDLGYGLGDVFANDPFVHVIQKGKIDTGLARPDTYNWPAALETDIHSFHPGAVVMMLGANDEQSLAQGGRVIPLSSPLWDVYYSQRISLLLTEATDSGAHVLWVGLPPLNAPSVNSAFAKRVNALAKKLIAGRQGVTYVSSWSTLAGPKGSFAQYKKVDGSVQQIRYSDGVHLAPTGWDLLASALLAPMRQAWKINLHAAALMRVG